jgi:6-phosphogluconolactonase
MTGWRERIVVLPDRDQVVARAAELMVRAGCEAIKARGRYMLALSGGSTPPPVFRRLAAGAVRDKLEWPRVHVFWVDERCVPPDHADSNYGMAREWLLRHVPVGSIHRMRGEDDPGQAAQAYEAELMAAFSLAQGEVPQFDMVLLGMGPDGHLASLFPGTPALHERERLVVAPHVPKLNAWRISLTFAVLNAARSALVVVSGESKRGALQRLLIEDGSVDDLPIRGLDLAGDDLQMLADVDAAADLDATDET